MGISSKQRPTVTGGQQQGALASESGLHNMFDKHFITSK